MPLYTWVCKKCSAAKEILRTFDQNRDPPTPEEAPTDDCEHDWDKKINAPLIAKSASWGPGKGHWLWLAFIGGALCSVLLRSLA